MRKFVIVLLLMLIALPAQAASRAEPAFRAVSFEAGFPWREGLTLSFPAAEQECKRRYGSRWRQKCSVALGAPGSQAKGVKLTPPAKGRWEWRSPTTLAFVPENRDSLKPGTLYQADFSGLRIPGFVRLPATESRTYTRPLAAMLEAANFWPDPAAAPVHRLEMRLEFNFPAHDPVFDLTLPPGAKAGKPEIVWNTDRDRLAISWPITSLPEHGGEARLDLRDVGRVWRAENGLRFSDPAHASFSQALPARDQIFNIKKVNITAEQTESLDQRYVLEVETTLHTTARDILANMFVVELPEYNSAEAITPYDWASASAISGASIKKGRFLNAASLQEESAPQSKFRFDLPVRSGRHVFVRFNSGLKSAGGIALRRDWAGAFKATPFESQVGFLQPGHILGASTVLDLFGSDLDAIAWEAQLVREPFLALLAQTSQRPFEEPLENADLEMESLAESARGRLALPAREQGRAQYAALDLGPILKRLAGSPSGLVMIRLEGLRKGEIVARASKLVLATDLSLLAKRNRKGGLDCFALRQSAGAPAGDAEVAVLGANGKAILTGRTGADGHITFPSLNGLSRGSRPVALLARKDGNIAWLPLTDRSRKLNFAGFDAGGSHVDANGTIAYVFSQRGLYRPGDTLYFGCMPRRGNFDALQPDAPLYAELIDPAGRKVWEKVFKAGESGLAELAWQSLPESMSGVYTCNVRNSREGDILGSSAVRMESFQPDTLKLKLTPPASKGWIVAEKTSAATGIDLQHLYGSPAAGHRVRAEIGIAPAAFRFAGFEEYVFKDPAPFLGNGASRSLPEQMTDEAGHAVIALPSDIGCSSALVNMRAEAFDAAGGRATRGSTSFLISPATRVLGYKLVGALTNPDFIPRGEKVELELLALDPELRPVAWPDLSFSLLRRNFITSLISDGSGGYHYDETPQELVVRSWRENQPSGPFRLALDTAEPGDFLLIARDRQGQIVLRMGYNVVGDRIASANEPLAASKMRIRLDRQEYEAGDEIKVAFALPYAATGLAAIERDGVEAFSWFHGHPGDNLITLKLPAAFEGKGYVTLTLMRSADSSAIYMDPLAYALAPFTASLERREMGLRLDAPKTARAGQPLNIELSSPKTGKAIVFAVDEGILQLAPWRDPAPLASLLGNRALDVATLQTADLLMPDHGHLAARISAFGGGAEASLFGKQFQNPFRRKQEPPLVFWSGLVETGPEPLNIAIPIKEWQTGRLRVFTVASGADCAGAVSHEVAITAPLILTPLLPNAVAPGDEFGGSLTIANTTDAKMELGLALSARGAKIVEPLPPAVSVAPQSEIVLPFLAIAGGAPGNADFSFQASSRTVSSNRDISLSVRPASALRTTLQAGMLSGPQTILAGRALYPELASQTISISSLPLPLAQSLARYLETYPYGCTEQLVSRSFAQIMLIGWPQTAAEPGKRAELLQATANAIASRFNGRFVGLWPNGEGDLLLTCYVADYLLALKEAGLAHSGLLGSICDSLSWNWALSEPSLASARASAYAIWVLARSGRVVTQQLETLLRSLDEHDLEWERDLTGALVAAIKKELALDASFNPASIRFEPDSWFDEYAQRSLLTTLVARYFPEQLSGAATQDFLDASLTAFENSAWSTFAAAQGIRALVSLPKTAAQDLANARLKCLDGEIASSLIANGVILEAKSGLCSRYAVDLPATKRPFFWQLALTGYDRQRPLEAGEHGIAIERLYLDKEGNELHALNQGDEVEARITVRSLSGPVRDCVISDLLPGGFEMIHPRQETLPDGVKAIDRQEDRLLVFADLADAPLEIVYRLRAIAPGKYAIPAATAEAMYDASLHGASSGGVLDIGRR